MAVASYSCRYDELHDRLSEGGESSRASRRALAVLATTNDKLILQKESDWAIKSSSSFLDPLPVAWLRCHSS